MKEIDLDIHGIYHELQSLDLELQELRNLNFYEITTLSDMPKGSKKKDKLIEYVDGLIRVENMLNYSIDKLVKKRKDAEEYIENIRSHNTRAIFRYHCINGKSWSWIANHMNSDWRVVKRTYYDQLEEK